MFHSILPPIHSATPCPLLPMAISKSTVQTGNLGNNPPHLLLPQPQETRSACCSLTSPDNALSLPYLPLQPQQQEDSLKTESIQERAGVTNVVVCQEKSDISVSPPPWPAPAMDPSSHSLLPLNYPVTSLRQLQFLSFHPHRTAPDKPKLPLLRCPTGT